MKDTTLGKVTICLFRMYAAILEYIAVDIMFIILQNNVLNHLKPFVYRMH